MPSGWGRAKTNRLPAPGTGAITAQRTPGRVSFRSTRWVPRLGRSLISGTSWPAQTPVALMTARARIVRVSPVRASVSTAPSPVGSLTRTRVCTRAPWAAAVRATASTRRASSSSWPSQDRSDAAQALAAYDGGQRERLGGADPARPGQRLAAGPGGQPEQVAGPGAAAGERAWERDDRGRQRDQHRQRVHQVRGGDLHQDAALDGALVGHVELALGQVAQAAVHQLGAPPAGAEGDVVGVDGDDVEAPAGGVERDSGAGDAEADDQHVRGLGDLVEAHVDATGHGCEVPLDEQRQLGVERRDVRVARGGAAPVSTMVCADSVKPWAASTSDRASDRGVAGADGAVLLALGDERRQALGDHLLAAAAPVEQVGEQHLGVDVDDPAEQRVLAQCLHGRDDAAADPARGSALGCRGVGHGLLDHAPHSRVIRSASRVWVSGQRR